MRRLLLIPLLAALTLCVSAQRMASTARPHFASRFHDGAHPRSSFLYPLGFSDPFYADVLSSTGYSAASAPPVIILQPLSTAAPAPAPSPAPASPLMIELRGDRYVQLSGPESSGAEMILPEKFDPAPSPPRRSPGPPRAATHTVAAPKLPPAILVFRDGHREETSDYTIADGVLYMRGDYYTNGSWNRKIELSSLDVSETIKSNQSRGVRFQLPSFPNEVIVRP
jgi:hypothetical protein